MWNLVKGQDLLRTSTSNYHPGKNVSLCCWLNSIKVTSSSWAAVGDSENSVFSCVLQMRHTWCIITLGVISWPHVSCWQLSSPSPNTSLLSPDNSSDKEDSSSSPKWVTVDRLYLELTCTLRQPWALSGLSVQRNWTFSMHTFFSSFFLVLALG